MAKRRESSQVPLVGQHADRELLGQLQRVREAGLARHLSRRRGLAEWAGKRLRLQERGAR